MYWLFVLNKIICLGKSNLLQSNLPFLKHNSNFPTIIQPKDININTNTKHFFRKEHALIGRIAKLKTNLVLSSLFSSPLEGHVCHIVLEF